MNGTDGTHTERDRLRKAEYRARKREEAQSGVRPQAPKRTRKPVGPRTESAGPSVSVPQPARRVPSENARLTIPEMRSSEWHAKFLAALADEGLVRYAAAVAGVTPSAAYTARRRDPAFAKAFDEAIQASTPRLEQEAIRRAFHGTPKPVYQSGKLVGMMREYSDTLLIFLLKGRKPDTYRDNVRVDMAMDVRKLIEASAANPDEAAAAVAEAEKLLKLR